MTGMHSSLLTRLLLGMVTFWHTFLYHHTNTALTEEQNERIALLTFRTQEQFMKERIALFKSGLYSFFKWKRKTGLKSLYHTFISPLFSCLFKKSNESNSFLLLLQKVRKERFALLKRAKDVSLILSTTSDSHLKPKSEFPTLSGLG